MKKDYRLGLQPAVASPIILAGACLDLAEQSTQTVDQEADEAHFMMEQPLKRASTQGEWD